MSLPLCSASVARRALARRCELSSKLKDCSGLVCLPVQLAAEVRMPKPLALDVKTRLVFLERRIDYKAGSETGQGAATETQARSSKRKAIRWVSQAAAAINGEVRPTSSLLRPELSLLVARARRRPRGRRRGEPGRTPDPIRARARGGAG